MGTCVKLKGAAVTGGGLRLLDIALEYAILVTLVILGLGSGSPFGCGSLGEEPWVPYNDTELAEAA